MSEDERAEIDAELLLKYKGYVVISDDYNLAWFYRQKAYETFLDIFRDKIKNPYPEIDVEDL